MSETNITGDQISATTKVPGTSVDSDFGSQDVKTSGYLWSTSLGVKFPDNSVQTTAGGGGGNATSIQSVAVSATAPTSGQGLVYNSGTTQWEPTAITATAAGLNTEVQYNNAGSLGASADFTWNDTFKMMGINLSGTGAPSPNRTFDVNGEIRSRSSSDSGGSGGFSLGDPNASSDLWTVRKSVTGDNFFIDRFNGSWLPTMVLTMANGNMGMGTSSPDASSLMNLESTTKGFLAPRMTTAQRTGIGSPADGLWVYDTTLKQYFFWDGNATAWVAVTSGGLSGAGATGRMAFWSSASALSSNANFTWDDTNKVMSIGPFPAGVPTGIPALFVVAEGSPATMFATTYGSGDPVYFGMHAGGTYASPSATTSGTFLVSLNGVGHDGTNFDLTNGGGSVSFVTTENWTGAAHGTKFQIAVCPNGSITESIAVQVTNVGGTARMAIGGGTASYPLDVSGDVNVGSGVYRNGGVAGVSGVFSNPTSITVNGGIITAIS